MKRSDLFAWDGPIGDPVIRRGVYRDPITAVAAVASIGGSVMGANAQKSAAGKASNAQVRAAQIAEEGLDERFNQVMALLQPYVNTGNQALGGMGNLSGLNGTGAQQAAINGIKAGPGYTSALIAGENSILQNAAATGGLRGGNTQAALAQFSPALLAQAISQQYGQLGGLAQLGQASAAGVGSAGMNAQSQIAQLQQQAGAARAGNYLAQGQANAGMYGSIGSTLGGLIGGLKF